MLQPLGLFGGFIKRALDLKHPQLITPAASDAAVLKLQQQILLSTLAGGVLVVARPQAGGKICRAHRPVIARSSSFGNEWQP